MDLWIRSQDKTELVKIEEICISIDDDGFVGVWSYGSNKHLKYYLGSYETKERALEVLDEIQTKIAKLSYQEHFIGKDFIGIESKVYEMPEK